MGKEAKEPKPRTITFTVPEYKDGAERRPDLKGDGLAGWWAISKTGDIYLSVRVFGTGKAAMFVPKPEAEKEG